MYQYESQMAPGGQRPSLARATAAAPERLRRMLSQIGNQAALSIVEEHPRVFSNLTIHTGSPEPAKFGARAFTRGGDIHLACGQEDKLPHELGHVVQQKMGLVHADTVVNGQAVNASEALERQADKFGEGTWTAPQGVENAAPSIPVIQCAKHHPLETDDAPFIMQAYQDFLATHPDISLEQYLIEYGEETKQYYERRRGVTEDTPEMAPAREKAWYDSMLARSIAALSQLHRAGATRSGSTNPSDEALLGIANLPYKNGVNDKMARAYGLNKREYRAIQAYTDAHKALTRLPLPGRPHNPFFMGWDESWGGYGNGWKALESALQKIPSMRQLGIQATTYRIPRTQEEIRRLSELRPGERIVHGHRPMEGGQRHYMSTSLTYSCHLIEEDVKKRGGVMAVTGDSGYYINPFGLQGILDGGEVLYPPMVQTRVAQARANRRYRTPEDSFPVIHLVEDPSGKLYPTDHEDSPGYPTLAEVAREARRPPLTEPERQQIYRSLDPDIIHIARERAVIHDPIAYTTDAQLHRLKAVHDELKAIRDEGTRTTRAPHSFIPQGTGRGAAGPGISSAIAPPRVAPRPSAPPAAAGAKKKPPTAGKLKLD